MRADARMTRRPLDDTLNAWLANMDRDLLKNPGFSTGQDIASKATTTFFDLGTGLDITKRISAYIVHNAKQELVLVTCFWAKSGSSTVISDILRALSARQLASGTAKPPMRVRICLSSSSFWQKLFHTQSKAGKIYTARQWTKLLHLPPPEELPGLDVQVKSIFMLPFSVMHPKFFILDRKIVLLPSCNISWESWFEGIIALHREIVQKFVQFWQSFWCHWSDCERWNVPFNWELEDAPDQLPHPPNGAIETVGALRRPSLAALFLPSNWHRNPRFRPLSWQQAPEPPSTPLNSFLLHSLGHAQKDIFMQTPNVTSPPVLSVLKTALENSVDVTIVTNERLMVLEQLLTAGTTTPRCLKKLCADHAAMVQRQADSKLLDTGESAGAQTIGRLRIYYFEPRSADTENVSGKVSPVSTHLKLTIVDGEVSVFGSGNMDRASWYTSQELGVALHSSELATLVRARLDKAIALHVRMLYDA